MEYPVQKKNMTIAGFKFGVGEKIAAKSHQLVGADSGFICFTALGTLTCLAPENRPGPKRKLIFQPSIFRCEEVSFREGIPSDISTWIP